MVTPSLSVANSARTAARMTRARQLFAVASETSTVVESIDLAAKAAGRPLLRLTLRQLLIAQRGWGENRSSHVINRMLDVVGAHGVPPRKLTIAWLLDPRAGGRRLMAFCDALKAKDSPPWPGFPLAAKPSANASETNK